MTYKSLLTLFVAIFALAVFATSVSAFGDISQIEVNNVDALDSSGNPMSIDFGSLSGDRVPVLVVFDATENAKDVRVKVWITGERENSAVSARFDILPNRTYSKQVLLDIPTDLREELFKGRQLEVVVEGEVELSDGSTKFVTADEKTVEFTVQRESYLLEILDIAMDSKVQAGSPLVIDVVVKNRGSQFADDTFVTARIPELGVEERTYSGDLSPLDQNDPDKEDSVERRLFLRIPADALTGVYTVQIEAFNQDSLVKTEKRVLITGAEDDTQVISSGMSKSFSTSETATYKTTLVNRGSSIRVYELSVDAPSGLDVVLEDSVVVVPAGSSKTVEFDVSAKDEGSYSFTLTVISGSDVIAEDSYRATVDGKSGTRTTSVASGNVTVLLTVILAIVFVVLLVVLIVLLTRKSDKPEEFGESYY